MTVKQAETERKAEENNLVCMCVYEREKEWEIYKQLYMLRGEGLRVVQFKGGGELGWGEAK